MFSQTRRTTINPTVLIGVFVFTAASAFLAWRSKAQVRFIWPALVALVSLFAISGGFTGYLFWFGLGLVFFLLADILLGLGNYFFAGLVALLLGHVFYIIAFNPTSIPISVESLVITVVVWGGALFLFRRLSAALKQQENSLVMQYPMLIFSLAISIMALSAVVVLARPDWALVPGILAALGGVLIFAADVILVYDRYVRALPNVLLLQQLAYLLGQFSIVLAVLMHSGRLG